MFVPLFTEGVETLQVLQIFPTALQLDDAIRYMMGTNGGEGAVEHRRWRFAPKVPNIAYTLIMSEVLWFRPNWQQPLRFDNFYVIFDE